MTSQRLLHRSNLLCMQEAGPSETDVASLRTIEQRQWELQQQENAYWHEMLVSGYQSRTYQMVSGTPAVPASSTSLKGGGAWWASPCWGSTDQKVQNDTVGLSSDC